MDNHNLPTKFAEVVELVIPAFDARPAVPLSFGAIKEGERRLIEYSMVNVSTYSNLSYTFNEGYREARKNIAVIGYELTQADKILRRIKSELILDEYPAYLKEKGLKDNASYRDAFLEKNPSYVSAQDRIDMLKAMEALMDGKIKTFENACRDMRKQIDIVTRSGIDPNKY